MTEGGRSASRHALAFSGFLALLVRLPTLLRREVLEGDGVLYASLAKDVFAGDFSGLSNPYWSHLWPAGIALLARATGIEVETAGRLLSLIAGMLLAPATGVFASRLFGPRTGVLAAVAVAAHPWLVHFSTLVYTESLFALLLVASLDATWRAAGSRSLRAAARAGLLASLALATRPEALAAVLVGLGLLAVDPERLGRVGARVFMFLAIVLVSVFARSALCHHYYGEWSAGVGTKGMNNLLIGMAGSDAEKERALREVLPDGTFRLSADAERLSIWRLARDEPGRLLRHAMGNGRKLIASAWRVMPPVPVSLGRKAFASALGPPLALLSAAALALAAAGALAPGAGAARAFVLLNLAVYLAGVGVLNVHDRLLVSPVPLFLVLSARGVETASARLMPERGFAAATLVLAGLAPVASYALVEAPRFLPYADEAIELRSAGLFVRDRFPPGHRLMTPLPTIAYYARGDAYHPDVVDMPWLPDSELVAFAAARDVDVVAAPERFLASIGHPARGLLRPDAPPNGLGLLGVWGTTPDRVCLYALDAARRGDP